MKLPRLSIAGIVLATLICIAFSPRELRAGEPLNVVKGATEGALQVLKDSQFRSKEKKPARIERLKQIINPIFDFEETAKRALGVHWRLSNHERKTLCSCCSSLVGPWSGTIRYTPPPSLRE
jgi:ABC-type transporter MlaC component